MKEIKREKFSEETIRGLREYGEALRTICIRLVKEGKVKFVNGKIVFLK